MLPVNVGSVKDYTIVTGCTISMVTGNVKWSLLLCLHVLLIAFLCLPCQPLSIKFFLSRDVLTHDGKIAPDGSWHVTQVSLPVEKGVFAESSSVILGPLHLVDLSWRCVLRSVHSYSARSRVELQQKCLVTSYITFLAVAGEKFVDFPSLQRT